jgi:hypothetical protein
MIFFKYIIWGNLFQEKMGKEKGSLCKANQIELKCSRIGSWSNWRGSNHTYVLQRHILGPSLTIKPKRHKSKSISCKTNQPNST